MFAKLRFKLEGWKTIIVNLMTGLPAVLYSLYLAFQTVDFTPLIPAKYVALYVVLQSVLGVVLRIMTKGPVGSKGQESPANVKAGD